MVMLQWVVIALVGIVLLSGVIALIVSLCTRSKGTQSQTAGEGSRFDGNTWQLIGWTLLGSLLTAITLGIAFPWAYCMVIRWEVKHTVINGRRLRFTGKGLQLLGRYLLWMLLTVVTLGIFGLFLGLKLKQWQVKHTVYADDEKPVESFFSGRAWGYLGIHLLAGLLTLVTFGIGAAWAQRMVLAWEARHTHIGGSPLQFNGTGGQLFVKYLLWGLLTMVTLGIFALFIPVGMRKWLYAHTDAVYQTKPIRERSRAHEASAVADYARFHLAANDTELAKLRSGTDNVTDPEELSRLAKTGDRFAQYRVAELLKGEDGEYPAEALAYLKASSDALYHPAMYAWALTRPAQEQTVLLEAAARQGSSRAPWLLAQHYAGRADKLQTRAYWFKVAMEWADPEALARQAEYETLITAIALQLSENQPAPKTSAAAAIVLGVLAALLLIGALAAAVLLFNLRIGGAHKEPAHNGEWTPGANVGYEEDTIPIDGWMPGDNAGYEEDTLPSGAEEEPGPEEDVSRKLLGQWCSLMFFDNCYVEEKYLTFYEDGTFTGSTISYGEVNASYGEIKAFDRYWAADGGGGSYGTYTCSDGTVTFTQPADMQNHESSWSWQVEFTSGGLTFLSEEQGRSWEFVPGSQVDYESTNSTREPSVSDGAASVAQQLVGSWSRAYRAGNVISMHFYTFYSDGTFSSYSQEYENGDFTHFMDYTGWYLAPMGYPLFQGTYSVEQSADGQYILMKHTTAMDGMPLNEIYHTTVQYVDRSSGRANFGEGEYIFGNYGFEELCRLMNVDMSTPTG